MTESESDARLQFHIYCRPISSAVEKCIDKLLVYANILNIILYRSLMSTYMYTNYYLVYTSLKFLHYVQQVHDKSLFS